VDLAGHRWGFTQSVADVDPAEWGAPLPEREGRPRVLDDQKDVHIGSNGKLADGRMRARFAPDLCPIETIHRTDIAGSRARARVSLFDGDNVRAEHFEELERAAEAGGVERRFGTQHSFGAHLVHIRGHPPLSTDV
jgi:hypothetical protein